MSKGTIAAILGTVLLLGGIGFAVLMSDDIDESEPVVTSIREEDQPNTEPTEEASGTEITEAVETDPEGVWTDYSDKTFADANQREDKKVLFFHASWCPTCKALERNLDAARIPDGLSILKVDYDTETELKQKYGVTYQHTLVQVDEDGNKINLWSGSYTVNDIVEELT